MNEWSLFGIEPTADKRTIKRAYAKLIKTIDPAIEPKKFQEVREAYDYLINYGRYYVDEQESEDVASEFEDGLHQSDSSVDDYESKQANQQLAESNSNLAHTVSNEPQDVGSLELISEKTSSDKVKNDETSALNESVVDEPQTLENPNAENESDSHDLTPVSIENQATEIASHFDEKNSYQSANEFLEKLEALFQSETTVEKSEWLKLIEADEYQYFEVNELLRVDVFGFLLHKVEQNLEKGNQPDKLKQKLLKQRLPTHFEWLVKVFAEHFDWRHTELILSNHFSNQQMNLLGQFYIERPVEVTPAQTETTESNGKSYIYWIIFLIILFKIFSSIESNKKTSDNNRVPEFSQSSKPTFYCLHYSLINSDQRAEKCAELLNEEDNKQRFILSIYWLNQYDKGKRSEVVSAENEEKLTQGVALLEQAARNNYLPAMNLLAWMKLGKNYQMYDRQAAMKLLQEASALGETKAAIALAVGHQIGLWGEVNKSMAQSILTQLEFDRDKLSANLNYAIGAAYWLNIMPPVEVGTNNSQKLAKQIFLDHSETVDLNLLNNVSWFFATANDESFDPNFAVNIARQLQPEYRNTQEWYQLDTLATAYASKGDFEMAVQYIDSAIALVKSEFPDPQNEQRMQAVNELKAHRALFENNQRVELEPQVKSLYSVLAASIRELMVFKFDQLPE